MDILGHGGCISYATTGRKKIQACAFILKCECEIKYFLRFKNIKQKFIIDIHAQLPPCLTRVPKLGIFFLHT